MSGLDIPGPSGAEGFAGVGLFFQQSPQQGIFVASVTPGCAAARTGCIKKGDTVKAIAGDDKGKSGKVLRVIPAENRAVVEGLNLVTKHLKPNAQNTQGRIEKIEAPIHLSNLQLVVGGKETRVGRKLNENGKIQRFAKTTGEFIK